MQQPRHGEYDDYYDAYISRVPAGDVIETLQRQAGETAALLAAVGDGQAGKSYAPGKWTLKQVLGHVIDTERVFGFRALAFARNDPAAIPGMEQDDYVAAANFNERTLAQLVDEFQAVRQATLALLRGLDTPEIEARSGTASGRKFTVRSVAYIIAGHEVHHMDVLRARYL